MDKIIKGDCIEVLKTLPDGIINTVITSPPYYGLRDYGIDGQFGLEETPEAYTQKLVELFREIRRVLRDDGTVWLNLGDSYAGSGGDHTGLNSRSCPTLERNEDKKRRKPIKVTDGLKPKDIIGIPWRVAFALQSDGWYLRQDIIWHKPNPMPESVTDRCTKSHEYIFLLSKSQKYYFDNEAIKEDASPDTSLRNRDEPRLNNTPGRTKMGGLVKNDYETRNKRSVWTVSTKPFSEAHFATFPEELINPCVLAGCPEGGLVYDPFMGAGTTALVAKKLARHYLGSELNPEYIKIAEKRLSNIEQSLFL
jgi:DNA modification methylase